MRERLTTVDYVMYALAVAIVGLGAIGVWDTVRPFQWGHARGVGIGGLGVPDFRPVPNPWRDETRVRIVLIGADERKGDIGRSDTLMVFYLNPQTKQAALLSLPRDMRAAIPGHRTGKINQAFSLGGPELSRQTVEGVIGEPMDYYAKLNFEGFKDIVDTLGGVDLEVETRMDRDDYAGSLHIHLRPGYQHLNGEQAMGYVRYRNDSDYNRMARQRKFLRELADQKLTARNFLRVVAALPKVNDALDTTLTFPELQALIQMAHEIDPDSVLGEQVPVLDASRGGVFYSQLDEDAFRDTLARIQEHLDSPPPTTCEVDLVDASGETGAGAQVAERLKAKGFRVAGVRLADGQRRHTEVRYKADELHTARWVTEIIECGKAVGEEDPLAYYEKNAPVRVIVGSDYEVIVPPEAAGGTSRDGGQPESLGGGT